MKPRSCHSKQWPRMTVEQSKLAEDNANLIFGYMDRHLLPQDDYYGICAIGLCKAAITYVPSRYKFSTLAYMCMAHEVAHDALTAARAKRDPGDSLLSLDYEYQSCEGGSPEEYYNRVWSEDDHSGPEVDEFLDQLPPKVRRDIEMKMDGCTLSEIGRANGQSHEMYRVEMKRIQHLAIGMGMVPCGA